MAPLAADLFEQLLAAPRLAGRRLDFVARRRLRRPYERRKLLDVVRLIVRLRHVGRLAYGRHLVRLQPIGDPHFVQVRIGRERQERCVLRLPTEATDRALAGRFEDRDLERDAAVLASERFERPVRNRFNEAVAEEAERHSERVDGIAIRHALLGLRTNRAIVDQRAAGDRVLAIVDANHRVLKPAVNGVAGAQLADLTGTTADGVLVTLPAALGVVDRTEAVIDRLDFVECLTVRVVRRLIGQAVRLTVEPDRRLGAECRRDQQGQDSEGGPWLCHRQEL
jgi:hypothetical protein